MLTNRRRIVIVTPGQLGSNPRVVKEAEALLRAGYQVHVIATQVVDFVEERDQSILKTAPFPVTRIPFIRRDLWVRERIIQKGARRVHHLTRDSLTAGLAASAMTRLLTQAACAQPADLYIAHYVAALPAAVRAARQHGAKYAFDAEDFHLGDLPDTPEHDADKELIRKLEGTYLPGAAYVTAASPMIAEAYAETYNIPLPTTILNVFPRSHAPAFPTPRGTKTPGPSLYWFSQTIGPGRGLETAIEAVALAETKPHLYLRGTPASGYLDRLKTLAAGYGVAERVHILDPVPPSELERSGAAFDIGLAVETSQTRNRRYCLTNKIFSYWMSGLPCVASDTLAQVRLSEQAGQSLAIYPEGNAKALANLNDKYLSDPAMLSSSRLNTWSLAQGPYNWETVSHDFLHLVAKQL